MSEVYKIQVNDSEPIEVSQQVYEVSFCFNEMLKEKDKEIERLNNIINKIDKLFEADTHCEDIYYAIGVVLNKKYHDIKMISNEEILNILGSDKE